MGYAVPMVNDVSRQIPRCRSRFNTIGVMVDFLTVWTVFSPLQTFSNPRSGFQVNAIRRGLRTPIARLGIKSGKHSAKKKHRCQRKNNSASHGLLLKKGTKPNRSRTTTRTRTFYQSQNSLSSVYLEKKENFPNTKSTLNLERHIARRNKK